MRRKSERGKTKPTEQPKEESHEKSKRSHRHSRRRKKSSSSSEGPPDTKDVLENIPQPKEVEVKDIELPQGEHVQAINPSDKNAKSAEEPKDEWKEDNKFWESEGTKTTQESLEDGSKEKEESSLWKVQSANGAGGEIQKLKICRQRPTESPEIAESSLHKSPKNETLKSHSSRSSSDSEASDNAKSHKEMKKHGRQVLSTVQRKKSSSSSPKRESPDSEDVGKKKEGYQQESSEAQENKDVTDNKENEKENSSKYKENTVEETNGEQEVKRCPKPRKRRWGSSWSNRSDKNQTISISTDTLKTLIPDAKPVPVDELQLSVEEEEGQLDDDEDDDDVVALVVKEEEMQLERERQNEEKEKEKEKQVEEKKRRQERFERRKSEQEETKVEIPRKIHLLTDDAKKVARLPSPPRRKPTSVLFISHLVRPFTVQQLKNLLLRTGTIAENGFWIDKIKSKCYVEYTTEDAAIETRHALHGVKWPTSNPKTLSVEFSTHDDLVMAQTLTEEPEVPRKAEPLTMVEGWVADQARIKERSRRTVVREWDVGKPEHPDEILEQELKMKEKKELERRARKERPHHSTTPDGEPPERKPRRKDDDAPAKLLDDLFRKTKTSPCIYWLPLTQEQISVKEEMRRQHMAEHERRMAELKKAELVRRDRERRTRK